MLYYAFGFMVVAILTLVLGLAGVAPGAAGVANLAFLTAVILLGAVALSARHRNMHHTRRWSHHH